MVARYSAASVDANVPIPAAKILLSVERVLLEAEEEDAVLVLVDDEDDDDLVLLFFVFRNDD